MIPTQTPYFPRPHGLHRATYARLIREYNHLLAKLKALPQRRLTSRMRAAYQRQFENRIIPLQARSLDRCPTCSRIDPGYKTV